MTRVTGKQCVSAWRSAAERRSPDRRSGRRRSESQSGGRRIGIAIRWEKKQNRPRGTSGLRRLEAAVTQERLGLVDVLEFQLDALEGPGRAAASEAAWMARAAVLSQTSARHRRRMGRTMAGHPDRHQAEHPLPARHAVAGTRPTGVGGLPAG